MLLAVLAFPIVGGCASGTAPPAAPTISSTTDATGGLLVVGDLLDVNGTNLSMVDTVLVDDKAAKIVSQTDTDLRVQIPQGVKNGQDALTLQYTLTDGSNGQVSDTVTVHRLVVFIGATNNKIVVADTTDQSVAATFDATVYGVNPPLVPATVNNGSLALVPTGRGLVYWIDLTANPPVIGHLNVGAGELVGVAVSPAGDLAAATDFSGNAVFAVSIQEALPPYTTPIGIGGLTMFLANPGAGTFFSADHVVVPLQNDNELAVIKRSGNAFTDTTTRVDVGNIHDPTMARLAPDGAKVLVPGRADGEVRLYTVSGNALAFGSAVQPTLVLAVALDVDPTSSFVYVVDADKSRVVPIQISGTTLTLLAPGPAASSAGLNCIAVDPVEGKYLYLGKNAANYVDIFDIAAGSTLTLRAANPLGSNTDLDHTVGIIIQP
jgi:hypothetical protein